MTTIRTIATVCALGLATFALTACETWMGGTEAPPLPGKRVSVLQHESSLTPDPDMEASQIRLPAPSPTPDWPT